MIKMASLVELIENDHVNHYIKRQMKRLKKNKNGINCKNILKQVSEDLKEKYNIIKITSYELIIKIDKRKNTEEIKKEIEELIKLQIKINIDIDFLFKFILSNNEIIVRVRRLM
jgi:hypothetical protein